MKTEIEKMLEEARDGDLVKLVLKEDNIPRVKEHHVSGNYMRITISLEKVFVRPSYGMDDSSLIKSVVGYYGGWFGEEKNIAKQQVKIYPMRQEVLAINSSPPIRIEIPLTEIESYEIIQKGEEPVTPPLAFP